MSIRRIKGIEDVSRLLVGESTTSADAILSTSLSCDGLWISASTTQGPVCLFSTAGTSEKHKEVQGDACENETIFSFTPKGSSCLTTCARFSRMVDEEDRTHRMLVTRSDGSVQCWSADPARRSAKNIWCFQESSNGTDHPMVCEYSPDGSQFFTGGTDTLGRLYDVGAAEPKLVRTFEQSIGNHGEPDIGHSSRILAAKFVSPNLLISAGWETSAILWDTRLPHPVRTFAGSHVTGDGLDVMDDTLLTVSERTKNQVQLFDIGTGVEKMRPLSVDSLGITGRLFRTARGLGAWIGGRTSNALYCLDLSANELIGAVTDLEHPVFSIAIDRSSPATAVAGGGQNMLTRVVAALPK